MPSSHGYGVAYVYPSDVRAAVDVHADMGEIWGIVQPAVNGFPHLNSPHLQASIILTLWPCTCYTDSGSIDAHAYTESVDIPLLMIEHASAYYTPDVSSCPCTRAAHGSLDCDVAGG